MTPRTRRRTRLAAAAAACLFLGAVMSIAVAWACVLAMSPSRQGILTLRRDAVGDEE